MADKRFALLIDSENISSKYISVILGELSKYGTTTYKRIYGDWTDTKASRWKGKLLEHSIVPIQQFANTTGKNATDSAMIIDAMDILYSSQVDGFCLVSSDSDFTRLASRLRESGMTVIGMGEEKTPLSFRSSCTIFTNLEVLLEEEEKGEEMTDESGRAKASDKETAEDTYDSGPEKNRKIISTIIGMISDNEDKGKTSSLGEIGNRLLNKYTDFDVRNFGYSSLSRFIQDSGVFDLKRVENSIILSVKSDDKTKGEIVKYIKAEVGKHGKKGIGINQLSNELHSRFKNFRVKQYGYSQFSKFVQSLDGVEVYETDQRQKMARKS